MEKGDGMNNKPGAYMDKISLSTNSVYNSYDQSDSTMCTMQEWVKNPDSENFIIHINVHGTWCHREIDRKNAIYRVEMWRKREKNKRQEALQEYLERHNLEAPNDSWMGKD